MAGFVILETYKITVVPTGLEKTSPRFFGLRLAPKSPAQLDHMTILVHILNKLKDKPKRLAYSWHRKQNHADLFSYKTNPKPV